MSRAILPRHAVQVAVAAFCGVLVAAATAQAETKTWSLGSEFPRTAQNPVSDKYGNKAVWSYMSGVPDGTRYAKLAHFFGAAEVEAACGIKEVYEWAKEASVEVPPAIWYNAGPTVEEGQDLCAPRVTLATKTAFMHPKLGKPGSRVVDAVARWKSPITGTVTVSGWVQRVDSAPRGIAWHFDRGTTVLASGESFEDNVMPFETANLSVLKGEFLNLEVGRALTDPGFNDSTAVSVTITSP
jgi:hypothetical protein